MKTLVTSWLGLDITLLGKGWKTVMVRAKIQFHVRKICDNKTLSFWLDVENDFWFFLQHVINGIFITHEQLL